MRIMAGVNPQVFFVIQVVADVVLCIAVVFIIARISQDLKKRRSFVKTMAELKRLILESQKATAGLLEAMEESKKALRDMSLSIDEKEDRLNRLIERASSHIEKLDKTNAGIEDVLPGKKNDEVLRLAGRGFAPAEIAESLGLSEGEIRLIIDLSRRKSASR
ncbi:MAG TPA: hypothetical protein VFG28_11715 [Syntrophales bacterium]|nr:hypothetical protein [Syntrophales bacterium]